MALDKNEMNFDPMCIPPCSRRIREKQMELNLDTELSKHGLKSVNAREKV